MYAIYLNDTERFIALEKDLWIIHLAAKLLSSKLSICICDIGNESSITNNNCLQWTMSTPDLPASTQYPKLIISKDSKLEFVGDPVNTDTEVLKRHQKFCLLALKIVKAAKMTDILLNHADRKYFQSLLESTEVVSSPDDSGIPGGFLHNIEKILYLQTSEKDILSCINVMFNDPTNILPRNLAQYKFLFYKYLNA
jgi:hypothetical protein